MLRNILYVLPFLKFNYFSFNFILFSLTRILLFPCFNIIFNYNKYKQIRYQLFEILCKQSLLKGIPASHINSFSSVIDCGCSYGISSAFLKNKINKPVCCIDLDFSNLFKNLYLSRNFNWIQGAIGKKSGFSKIIRSNNIEATRILDDNSIVNEIDKISYYDISDLIIPNVFIKVDIEGSEYSFIDSYISLINKNALALFIEFHDINKFNNYEKFIFYINSNFSENFNYNINSINKFRAEIVFWRK